MNSLKDHYLNVHASINQLYREIPERRNRFHAFLLEHDPQGFASYELEALSHVPESPDYDLAMESSSTQTLRFSATVTDWGDSSSTYFCMPVDYLDDPDTWEKNVLQQPKKDRKLAVKVLKAILGDDFTVVKSVKVQRPSMDEFGLKVSERFLNIHVSTKGDSDLSGDGKGKKFLDRTPSACYDRAEGILHYGHYKYVLSVANSAIDEDHVVGRFRHA